MGIPILDNSDKMKEHMKEMLEHLKDVKESNCDHKPDLGAVGTGPTTCVKCGIKLKKGFVPDE